MGEAEVLVVGVTDGGGYEVEFAGVDVDALEEERIGVRRPTRLPRGRYLWVHNYIFIWHAWNRRRRVRTVVVDGGVTLEVRGVPGWRDAGEIAGRVPAVTNGVAVREGLNEDAKCGVSRGWSGSVVNDGGDVAARGIVGRRIDASTLSDGAPTTTAVVGEDDRLHRGDRELRRATSEIYDGRGFVDRRGSWW